MGKQSLNRLSVENVAAPFLGAMLKMEGRFAYKGVCLPDPFFCIIRSFAPCVLYCRQINTNENRY